MILRTLAFVLVCAALPLGAVPITCSSTTLDVLLKAPEGCSSGLFTFKNWKWINVGGQTGVTVDPAAVSITPSEAGALVGVVFTSSAFSVSGPNFLRYSLEYLIDPPPVIIDGFDLNLISNTPVAPGFATITSDVCAGDLFANSCAGGFGTSLFVAHFGTSSIPSASVTFPRPVNLVDVRTRIVLEANGASSSITGAAQRSPLIADPGVPEPASVLLMLGGMLGLYLLRVRTSPAARD